MSAAAVVVRKEIPAKTKTYLAFGLWIMEKTMTEEEARNKMIEMFIGCETVDAICGKFEAFNEKEMVEKLVQIHKSLKPKPIKKKKEIESPDNIVNELVSLATNSVPAVPENVVSTNAVPENVVSTNVVLENVVPTKPTEEKKKRAAPKANVVPANVVPANVVPANVVPTKPTEDKANVVPTNPTEDKATVVPESIVPVVESIVSEVKTSDAKKKRVVKPKAESVVPSVVATESENVVIESAVIESVVPSVVKAPKKKATPKAKAEATEAVVSKPVEEAVKTNEVVTEAPNANVVPANVVPTNVVPTNVVPTNVVPTNVVPTKPTEDKKKRATPKAKATSENVVPSATTSENVENENEVVTSEVQASENEVVTSEVQASESVVPSANVVPSTEDKKKKPKTEKPKAKPAAPTVVESPKNVVGVPEEFEDTELVVKEFVYGTKSYYIDEEETIYEQEGLKKIGKLVNGKLVFDSV
jgi:hypothetical protein